MDNEVHWTDEQKEAIDHRHGGAIVTAGAGSGKTAVLSARIVDMFCDKENYTDPSKTAIITFTKKAANELKTRLKRQMRERLAENPQNTEFLRRQNTLLHSARISTISSFCFTLIKENITLSTLASGFEIMEESRAAMTRYAVAEMAVEEFYKNSDEKDRELILEHFVHKNDRPLVEAVLSISAYAANLPEPDSWYEHCRDASRLDDIFSSSAAGYNKAKAELLQLCDEIRDELKQLSDKEKPNAAQKRAKECIEALLPLCTDTVAELDKAIAENDFNGVTFLDKKKIKSIIPPYTKAKVGDSSEKIKAAAEELAVLFESAAQTKTVRASLYKSQPVIDILIDITRRFEQLYAAEKEALNAADYSDAERQLYNMLKNNPGLREKIGLQLIIVDEFQDSNRLQYEIFEMLSDNSKNLYFVGDIKQSIYAFRGAQSEVFDEVTKNPVYTCYNLNHNFRSRDNVIKGINEIFSNVMTEELGGVNYAENSLLIAGDPQNRSDDPEDMTEILLVTDDDEYAEAKYVAYHINEMIKSGYKVEGRPCTAEDFAIILRATSEKSSHYAEALAEYDIRSTTKKDGGFFSEPEICIMLDYLRVIDDPYNDESLARVLMSCIVSFSADKIAAIRTCTSGFDIAEISACCEEELTAYAKYWQKKSLYTCVKAAVKGYEIDSERFPGLYRLYQQSPQLFGSMTDSGCIDFEAQLDRLRGVMAASSPAELIKCIYDTTPVADLLTVGENSEARRANLAELLTIASDYGRHHSDGILSDLLSHLKQIGNKGLKVELSSGGASAGVQIMTIHASKGLEFPIVFVCDCAKPFNTQDAYKNPITSIEYGICIRDVNKAMMAKIPSPAYKKTSELIIRKARSEEMRLLYVAATRAKYKLIFTGKKSNGLENVGTADSLIDKISYLSWLLVPYARQEELSLISGSDFISSQEETTGALKYKAVSRHTHSLYSSEEVAADERSPVTDDNTEDTSGKEEFFSVSEVIKEQISGEYAYRASTELAAKYTATGLASMMHRDNGGRCELYVSRPSFMEESDGKKLSGKKKGDAYHKLMEHIPFDKPVTEQQAKEYIENCTDDFLSDAERECIIPSDISRFFTNEIAARMLKAVRVYREYPIFHRLSGELLSQVIEDYDADNTDGSYVQGIADMFFIEEDGIVLVDYKTDSFSDEDKLTKDYSFQLRVYAEALHKAFSLPVKEMYIYSFKKNKMVKIKI